MHLNKPCPECGGSDRFYLITQPHDGSSPYWRCRHCDYTEPHDEDIGEVDPNHTSRQIPRTAEQIADAQYAYTQVARHCADALWSKEGEPALAHLRKRGLNDATIRSAQLGWCADGAKLFTRLFYQDRRAYDGAMDGGLRRRQGIPTPVCKYTITIPYMENDTSVLLRGRKLVTRGKEPKYLSPRGPLYAGAEPHLYLHTTMRDQRSVILTEGELKALAAYQEWQAGRSPYPCVAACGVSYLPVAFISALSKKIVYLAYDSDKAGRDAVIRNGNKLRAAGITVKVIELPNEGSGKVDLDSYILAHQSD